MLYTSIWILFACFADTFFMILSQKGDWAAEKVITIPPKKVEGWALPDMPGIYLECLFAFDFQIFFQWRSDDYPSFNSLRAYRLHHGSNCLGMWCTVELPSLRPLHGKVPLLWCIHRGLACRHISYIANVCNVHKYFFSKIIFGGHKSLLWGHWYPCFGILVTSALGFKARAVHSLVFFLTCTQQIPQIHLWLDTCWPFDGQHGSHSLSQMCVGEVEC